MGESDLVKAAKGGDAKALSELLEREQSRVYRYSMKMCGHPEDAEDVLQETLLAMAESVGDFRGASSVSTWLYAITRSFCSKKRRKSKFAPEHEEQLEESATHMPDPGADPEEAAQTSEVRRALDKAIQSLDSKYREVFVLRDVEGLTAAEVAEVLDISVAAIKSRLHRARAVVRDQLAPMMGVNEERGEGCPDVISHLSRHLEGDLSQDTCAEMERHIASCTSCEAACDSLRQTLALCKTSAHPEVPSAVKESVRKAIAKFLTANVQDV